MTHKARLSHTDYTVGWICALPIEMAAAQALLDEVHECLPVHGNDHNTYTLGAIGEHNVVLCCLPSGIYGPSSAQGVATGLLSSFPSIRFGLMVGIGGGVPSKDADIRLGDVVVSKPTGICGGVVQYDSGKALTCEGADGFQRTGMLNQPPHFLLTGLSKLQANHIGKCRRYLDFLTALEPPKPSQEGSAFIRPTEDDCLYPADYEHVDPDSSSCGSCDPTKAISRPIREPAGVPAVHYGLIASGNTLVRDARLRDKLGKELGVHCVEMEAAGLMNSLPCLVVRGICDYADSHKNKKWQGYAAAVAVALTKELLLLVSSCKIEQTHLTQVADADYVEKFRVPFDLLGVPAIDEFVGRQDELNNLWATLQPGGSQIRKIAILHGLGGIGKTQLAIRFARMHKDDYSAIFWFNARDRDTLTQSLASAFPRVTEKKYPTFIAGKDEMDRRAQKMLEWLATERNSRWLLIYDNVDQSPLQNEDSGHGELYDVAEFMPTADHGSIIITTRITHFLELGQGHTVQRLSPDDARHLLLRSAGHSMQAEDDMRIDPEINELGCRLDGLPLAITLAGSYMRQTGMSFGQYLKHYQTSWGKLMAYSAPSRHYPSGNILTTWSVSYEAVQKTHPSSAELLLLLAVFDNRDIWFELIEGCSQARDLPCWFYQVACDHLSFMAAMKPLIGFSLVETKLDQGSYSIHPVLQDWCLHSNIKKCEGSNSDRLKAMALVSLGNTPPLLSEMEKSRLQQRLLPHADRMLHLLRTWRVPGKPNIYLAVHDVGCLYLSQGQFRGAEESYQRALGGKESLLGPDDTSTLETVNNLGLVYTNRGKLQDAEQMCQRALRGRERVLGVSHVSTLESVNNLGFLYTKKGYLPEAERLYKRALEGYQKALGPNNTLTLDTINNLGLLYAKCAKLKQAGNMYKQAIEGFENLFGPNHTSTLIVANNLADIYCSEGKIQEARRLYERALAGYKKVLGPDHTSTLMIADNLANLSKAEADLPSMETISSPGQTVSCKTKTGPTSGSRNFHGLGKVSYGRQDMAGWWICCVCAKLNSPDLSTGSCTSCPHWRCACCRLFY